LWETLTIFYLIPRCTFRWLAVTAEI